MLNPYRSFIPDNQQWQTPTDSIQAQNAKECADYCREVFALNTTQQEQAITPFVLSKSIKMPKSRTGWHSEKARLECGQWWSRQLKKRNTRQSEQAHIKQNKVKKYCSDSLLLIMQQQQARLADWLSRSYLDGDNGEKLELDKLAQHSTSNPKLRRNELMTRIKGMEQYAAIFGHAARFITVTAPSTMHRSKGAQWAQMTPKQVQNYLTDTWAKCRAKLARQNINIYGVRVTEPHKDACPHWHLLAWFTSTKQAQIAVKTIRHYFLQKDGQEQGALFNRVKTITINPLKGGAAAYVAKYVCKNVDGAHVDTMTDRDGQAITDGKDGSSRVKAWASCWGARQFQFIGGAPIGLWRELRRVRDSDTVKGAAWLLWNAADTGDYCAFMLIYAELKGMGQKPKLKKYGFIDDLKLLAAKYDGAQNIPDDEILTLKTLNKYGEPKSKIVGVAFSNSEIKTRQDITWTIKTESKKADFLTPQNALEIFANVKDGDLTMHELVNFADMVGVFRDAPQGAASLDLWQ
jgi:hypothetical protein